MVKIPVWIRHADREGVVAAHISEISPCQRMPRGGLMLRLDRTGGVAMAFGPELLGLSDADLVAGIAHKLRELSDNMMTIEAREVRNDQVGV